MAKAAIGFGIEERIGEDTDAINRLFTSEFRNRLDAIVPFKNLPREVVTLIVDKFVMGLETQLEDRGVTIQLTQRAKDKLAKDGYDPQMARASAGSFDSKKRLKSLWLMLCCSVSCKTAAWLRLISSMAISSLIIRKAKLRMDQQASRSWKARPKAPKTSAV